MCVQAIVKILYGFRSERSPGGLTYIAHSLAICIVYQIIRLEIYFAFSPQFGFELVSASWRRSGCNPPYRDIIQDEKHRSPKVSRNKNKSTALFSLH